MLRSIILVFSCTASYLLLYPKRGDSYHNKERLLVVDGVWIEPRISAGSEYNHFGHIKNLNPFLDFVNVLYYCTASFMLVMVHRFEAFSYFVHMYQHFSVEILIHHTFIPHLIRYPPHC